MYDFGLDQPVLAIDALDVSFGTRAACGFSAITLVWVDMLGTQVSIQSDSAERVPSSTSRASPASGFKQIMKGVTAYSHFLGSAVIACYQPVFALPFLRPQLARLQARLQARSRQEKLVACALHGIPGLLVKLLGDQHETWWQESRNSQRRKLEYSTSSFSSRVGQICHLVPSSRLTKRWCVVQRAGLNGAPIDAAFRQRPERVRLF